MEAAGAGDAFRGIYEGSISGSHLGVERKPYHKNCSCAVHDFGASKCPHRKTTKIAFPIRRSWSEGSFAIYAASTASSSPSPSSSPSIDRLSKIPSLPPTHHRNLVVGDHQDNDRDDLFLTK